MAEKTALVIGGSGGIGSAIVKRLLDDGFFVCATYAHHGERWASLCLELQNKPALLYQVDLLDENATSSVMDQIVKEHPRIHVVVFAPSLPLPNTLLFESKWHEFEDHFHAQVRGMWQVIKGLWQQIQSKNGIKFVIVLTESCIGKPPSRLAPYVTAKYALLGFAKIMAVELSTFNCKTNCVSPGIVETELTKSFPPKTVELARVQNPLKRIAKPEDVASVVSFLSSKDSDYLNGTHITVNGGSVML